MAVSMRVACCEADTDADTHAGTRPCVPGSRAPTRRSPGWVTTPHWWAELLLVAIGYLTYSTGRLLARGDVAAAIGNGRWILHAERLLRLDPELALNKLFTQIPKIGVPADFAYASLHYLITPLVLVWIWRRRPNHYRTARTWLALSTFIGLIGFTLLPTAPPRLLDASNGFVDTMAKYASYGWWGGDASAPRGLGSLTNQYAALPSLHVGWALWCGVLVWRLTDRWLARAFAVLYPLVTTLVVLGTANHYLLDALAGVAVMATGAAVTHPALRLVTRVRQRLRPNNDQLALGA